MYLLTIDKLNELPDKIRKEILNYADYLISKYNASEKNALGKKWAVVRSRGISKGESSSRTVIRNREEDKW
jgi:hypothetical protein